MISSRLIPIHDGGRVSYPGMSSDLKFIDTYSFVSVLVVTV